MNQNKRNAMIEKLFRRGCVLQEIGEVYGITRERVRQILKKRGVTWEEGGQHMRAIQKEVQTEKKRDKRIRRLYSLTLDEYRKLKQEYGCTLFDAYRLKKRNCKYAKIPFHLTFAQWWQIWRESGQWNNCGLVRGKYVMGRIDKDRGYETGNVHIIKLEDNSRDSIDWWIRKNKPPQQAPVKK